MICGLPISEPILILTRRIAASGDTNLSIYDVIMRIDTVPKSSGTINVAK